MARHRWEPTSLWAYHPFENLAREAALARFMALSGVTMGGFAAAFVAYLLLLPGGSSLLQTLGIVLLLLPPVLFGLPILQFKVEIHGLNPEAYDEGLLIPDGRILSWRATRLVPWTDVTVRDVGSAQASPGGPAKSFGQFGVEARVEEKTVFRRVYTRHSTIGESGSEGLYDVLQKRAIKA